MVSGKETDLSLNFLLMRKMSLQYSRDLTEITLRRLAGMAGIFQGYQYCVQPKKS